MSGRRGRGGGEGGGVVRVMTGLRRRLVRRLSLAAVLWAGVVVAVLLLAAWALAGPAGWGQGARVPLLLHAAGLVLLAAGLAGALHWRRRKLCERELSRTVELEVGLPRGSVIGALELSRAVPAGVSPGLVARGERDLAGRLSGGDRQGPSGGKQARLIGRALKAGALAALLLLPAVVLVGTAAPERALSAWTGVLMPYGLLAEPSLPPLALEPGDVEVPRGSDLEVTVHAPGREEVHLHRRAEGEVPTRESGAVRGDDARFTVRGITAPTEYWVESPDGHETARFRIVPVDPLLVGDLRVELSFPPHTGRPAEEYRGAPPPLSVPQGTRIGVEGRANRSLERAELRPLDGAPGGREGEEADGRPAPGEDAGPPGAGTVELEVEGDRFHGSWVPGSGGLWAWHLDAGEGDEGQELSPLDLTVMPDEPPTVAILHPGPDADLPLSFRQPLEIEARDDFGVDRVELVAWRVDRQGEAEEPRTHRLDAGEAREVSLRPVLEVSQWGLRPGDEVRYFARAVDNAPDPGIAESGEHVLRMPREAEIRRESERTLSDAAQRLEELGRRAGEATDDTRALERRNRSGRDRAGEMGYEEAEEYRSALDRQEGMLDDVEDLREELSQLGEGLRDAGVMDPELQSDLRELEELLRELASPELRERLEEWREAFDGGDRREALEGLRDLEESQEEFRQRLEESLERFRRAAAEEDFRALSEEARELAREEDELGERFRDGEDLEADAEHQEHLAERARELAQGMEALEDRLERMGETEAAERARDAMETAERAREQMEQAAEAARAGDGESAGELADQAAGEVDSALQELMQAREEMAAEWEEALRKALEQAALDALSLSRRQAEIGEGMARAGFAGRSELRREEAALMEGARNLHRNVSLALAMAPQIGQTLGEAIAEALEAMHATQEALGRRILPTSSASSRVAAARAVHALNRVAWEAMALSSGGGEGEDAGGEGAEDLLSQLDELAAEQQDLAEQSGAMMDMTPDMDGFQEMMEQLALGQQEVADILHELAERPGGEWEPLGDLAEMGEEAREIAEELRQERLEPEVQERQERLFQRLLDAGRGVPQEQEEESEEREGTTAGEVDRPMVEPLDPEDLGRIRFPTPGAEALQALTPAQRRLVLDYFERLNRRTAPEHPPQSPEGGP